MGLGMVLAVDKADAERTLDALKKTGEAAYVVGETKAGSREVIIGDI